MSSMSISTQCICTYIDDDDVEVVSQYCDGCFTERLSYLEDILNEWSGDEYRKVLVTASGMTWQRLDAVANVKVNRLHALLKLNGDYQLDFTLNEDGTGKVMRYSHDEPVGASFTLELMSPRELNCPMCDLPTYDTFYSDIKAHNCAVRQSGGACRHFEDYETCSCDSDDI